MQFLIFIFMLLQSLQSFPEAAAHPTKGAPLPLPYRVIHEFPNPTWIENLAVRSNEKLLLTEIFTGSLYLLDPSSPNNPQLVHNFTGNTALLGITELGHDIFYVGAGSPDLLTGDLGIGTYGVWKVDMNRFEEYHAATVEKVTDIPEAHLFNGMTTFSEIGDCGTVLIADSALGLVFKLDVTSGKYSTAIQVPEMAGTSSVEPVGINGIKLLDGYLYWTNSDKGTFNRIRVDSNANAIGAAEVIASNQGFEDDFVLDKDGNAWVATDSQNTINIITRNGKNVTVEGAANQLTVAGSTACQFGRTLGTRHTLYVTTNGGLSNPLPGDVTEGGKVVAIDTKGFDWK